MATLDIEGKEVEVDDSFFALTAEEQSDTVEQIASTFEWDEDELRQLPGWIENSKKIYAMNEGPDAEGLGSDEEYAQYGLEFMGWFNYNLPKMGYEAAQLTQAADDDKKAFLYMMNKYDQKNVSLAGTGRFFAGVLSDPTTYVGLATLGFGTAAAQSVKVATKEGLKQTLKAGLKAGAKIGAAEGAIYGAADNSLRQSVRMQADAQEEFSFSEVAGAAAMGSVAGGVLGGAGGALAGAVARRGVTKAGADVADEVAPTVTPQNGPIVDDVAPDVPQGERQGDLFDDTDELAPATQVERARAENEAVQSAADLIRKANRKGSDVVKEAAEQIAQRIETRGLDNPANMQTAFEAIFNSFRPKMGDLNTNPKAAETVMPLVKQMARMFSDKPEEAAEALLKSGTMEDFIARNVATQTLMKSLSKETDRVAAKIKKVAEKDPELARQMEAEELAPLFDAAEAVGKVHKELGTAFGVALKSRQFTSPELNITQLVKLRAQGVSMTEAVTIARNAAVEAGIDVDVALRPSTMSRILRSVIEYRANALLSGPVTQEINILSTMANLYLRPAFEIAGSVFDRRMGKEIRTAAMGRYIGMHHTFSESFNAAKRAFDEEKGILSQSRKFDLDEDAAISAEYWDIDPSSTQGKSLNKLGRTIRLISRSLLFTDEFFKQMAYKGEIVGEAMADAHARKLGKTETKALIDGNLNKAFGTKGNALNEAAQGRAEQVTFTNKFDAESQYAGERLAADFETLLKKMPVIRLFQPFYRTPVRLMEQGLRMSGLGLTTKLFGMQNKFYDDLAGKNGARNAAIARSQMSYAIGSLGLTAMAVSRGQMTGGLTSSKDYERKRELSEVAPPYSIKIRGKWYSYQRFEPFATPLKIMADIVEGMERVDYREAQGYYALRDEKVGDVMSLLVGSIARSTTSPTFMEGMDQFVTFLQEGFTENVGGQMASSFVPNLFKKIAGAIEPEVLEVEGYFKPMATSLKLAGTPRRDIYGRTVERDPLTGFWLFTGTEGDDDPIRNEINDVMEKAETDFAFPSPTSIIPNIDLSKERTSDDATTLYDKWKELTGTVKHPSTGRTLREQLEYTINSEQYQSRGAGNVLYKGGRHALLQEVFSKYRSHAKAVLVQSDNKADKFYRRDKRLNAIKNAPVSELLQ